MMDLVRSVRKGRGLALHCSLPLALKIGLWILVLAWGLSIAFEWLRDASANLPPAAVIQPRPAIDLEEAITQAAAAPLFGQAPGGETAAAAIKAPLEIKLKGVFAGGGGPMAAIVNTGRDEDDVAMLGRELQPGVVLEGIHPTHIVVGRDGASHRIELEAVRSEPSRSKVAARGNAAPGTPSPPAAPTEASPPPPAESEPSTPLAPPMPQSDAGSGSLSRVA
jgi:type II secretory pathway component PulC